MHVDGQLRKYLIEKMHRPCHQASGAGDPKRLVAKGSDGREHPDAQSALPAMDDIRERLHTLTAYQEPVSFRFDDRSQLLYDIQRGHVVVADAGKQDLRDSLSE